MLEVTLLSKKAIAKSAFVVMILTIISRLVGFFRDQLIALHFGASGVTDAYFVGITFPNLIVGIFGVAVSTAFLPVFTRMLGVLERREEAWRMVSSVFSVCAAVGIVLSAGGMLGAPWLVKLLAPGFSGETYRLAVVTTRIVFPGVLFMIVGLIAKATLNSFREFAVPALGPIIQNFVLIAGLVFVVRSGVVGLAVAMLLGMFTQLLIQIPALVKRGMRYRLTFDIVDPNVWRVGRLALPIIVGSLAGQSYIMVDRSLASHLATGSIAALTFADKVRQLPLGLFVAAITTVLYPSLADYAAKKDYSGLQAAVGMGLRLVGLITVPAAVGLAVLRIPVIRLLFERGAFGEMATAQTSAALLFYSLSIVALAANSVLTITFYGMQDMITPTLILVGGAVSNIFLDFLLVEPMGHSGLALANSVASFVMTMAFLVALRKKIAGFQLSTVLSSTRKIVISSIAMAVVAVWAGTYFRIFDGGYGMLQQVTFVGATIAISGATYGLLALLLGVEEVQLVVVAVRRKVMSRLSTLKRTRS